MPIDSFNILRDQLATFLQEHNYLVDPDEDKRPLDETVFLKWAPPNNDVTSFGLPQTVLRVEIIIHETRDEVFDVKIGRVVNQLNQLLWRDFPEAQVLTISSPEFWEGFSYGQVRRSVSFDSSIEEAGILAVSIWVGSL